MELLRKYNTATHVYIPIVKRAVVDFAVGADWTPAAGDVKISKDGGAAANVTNLPTAITMGNTAYWDFSLTATELSAAKIVVTVADSATKAVEDQAFIIATYGNASAEHAVDLDDSVRAGLTALPNAAAEAAGGLYTRGAGAGQINQQTNGQIDTNVERVRNAVVNALVAGRMDSSVGAMAADVITAAAIAAGAIGVSEAPNLDAAISSRLAPTTAGRTLDVTATGEAGMDLDNTVGTLAKGVELTGFNDLDAAGVRGAVGLAAANLDTQLAAIAAFIDTEVAAIKAKTDNLPASPAATGDAMALTGAAVDAIHDDVYEGTLTLRQIVRIVLAAVAGKSSGFPAGPAVYRDAADTKDRITATVDADGNRSVVTTDGT